MVSAGGKPLTAGKLPSQLPSRCMASQSLFARLAARTARNRRTQKGGRNGFRLLYFVYLLAALLFAFDCLSSLPSPLALRPSARSSLVDPCAGYPTPTPIKTSTSTAPTIFFLHVPKTAGSLLTRLLTQYASLTGGLSCAYRFDGNRYAPYNYYPDGTAASHARFPSGSLQAAAVSRGLPTGARLLLLAHGACRVVRGHVTASVLRAFADPPVTITVLRSPLDRFVSMYDFARSMVRARPGRTGWDGWVGGSSLSAEFANSSSLFHRGFVDEHGGWRARGNVGFSFHFYGVLHQLSGMTPSFVGEGDPYQFSMKNAQAMAAEAKKNLCKMHIVGLQESVNETMKEVLDLTQPWAKWSGVARATLLRAVVNRTPGARRRNIDERLSPRMKGEIERRLFYETEVYNFGKRIVAFRRARRLEMEQEALRQHQVS